MVVSIGFPVRLPRFKHAFRRACVVPPLPPLRAPLPRRFFRRPAECVAPDLIGCRLLRRQASGELLWGVIVETEAYSQAEPACHGHRRRSPGNETLFGEPGRFYVYVSYGIHHCVNVVTDRADWANGVLLRAAALPGGPERGAAGPGLLARHFAIDRRHDGLPATPDSGLWLAPPPPALAAALAQQRAAGEDPLRRAVRIGVSQGQELPWRWYLAGSRSVSRRAPGDRTPAVDAYAALLAS
jgi:DNA-3-methyladenine glycosylase